MDKPQCKDCHRATYLGTHTECVPKEKGGEYKTINPISPACSEFNHYYCNPHKVENELKDKHPKLVLSDDLWSKKVQYGRSYPTKKDTP